MNALVQNGNMWAVPQAGGACTCCVCEIAGQQTVEGICREGEIVTLSRGHLLLQDHIKMCEMFKNTLGKQCHLRISSFFRLFLNKIFGL